MSRLQKIQSALPANLRAIYPFSSHRFQIKADTSAPWLHFLDEGERDAPVVVLLHGNPTWSFFYRELIPLLVQQGFRCIAPDHIGCGLSDKPQQGYAYRLEQRIADCEALLDALGVERFSVIAHDWGGAIGAGVAGRRSEAVDKLVFMNTAAFLSTEIPKRIALCKLPLLGPFAVRALNAFAGPAVYMTTLKPMPVDVKAGYLYPYRNWHDRIAVARFVEDIPLQKDHPSYETLAAVENGLQKLQDKPLLLPWGMRDFCFTPKFLERWQSFFPSAQTLPQADCGHYLLEDGDAGLRVTIANWVASAKTSIN
jgi:pimeloyl-ACP methyl ester carboxylesterase